MKFRNYCIVVMGEMGTVKDEILQIAEGKPRYIDAIGILLGTFQSIAEPAELEDFFKGNKRTFFLFDLNKENSGYHMDNARLYGHLFGHLDGNEDALKEMTEKFRDEVTGETRDNKVVKKSVTKETFTKFKGKKKRKLSEMSKTERESLFNKILDKGVDRLTSFDKNLLKKISDYKQKSFTFT